MFIFMDTEFTGLDHPNPALISIGLVREDGESFYRELPPMDYEHRACYWVLNNVVPLLWGGSYKVPADDLIDQLSSWIASIDDRVVIVTDAPELDFEFLKALLSHRWPKNLAKLPLRFDSYAMGQDAQPWLEGVMLAYHLAGQPEHHALHDAHSLRLGMIAALERGWCPPH